MTAYLKDLPNTIYSFSTLVELLRYRGQYQPDKIAYTFLQDGETESSRLTYRELDQQAQAIAAYLQSRGTTGERALLLYQPGLEFISAFFGCLYAGIVAVPAYPPRRNHNLSRLEAIVVDAQATFALTTTSELTKLESQLALNPELARLNWLATDKIDSNLSRQWWEPTLSRETLSFVQYTSGSTGKPKGVMVSHGNLLHNERLIKIAFGHTDRTIVVGWLPLFHDMGLIGNVIQPLYLGIPCILISPVTFLQKPLSWLQTISRYKGTTSGGPNFAYELCVSKITSEQRETLDLSSWDVAFNGSEPIRAETLERFVNAFEPCGFRREAFYPCYGMAETTLFVSGGLKMASPQLYQVKGTALQQNRIVPSIAQNPDSMTIVSCGLTFFDQIVIVDPKSNILCPDNQVGEIWVSGPTVAQGYWNQPEATKQTFHAYLADTDASVSEAVASPLTQGDAKGERASASGPFLRTGDLGFFHNGELFVTGRLKDVIIIRGRNHYPQDIELTVEKSHPAIRLGCGAAFSADVEGQERLIIAYEIERSYLRHLNVDEVVEAIRKAVSEEHELQVYAVSLLKTGSIPKTSSGKIQRYACRNAWLSESLSTVGTSILKSNNALVEHKTATVEKSQRQLLLELDLRNQIAQILEIDPTQLNPEQSLISLGIDSLKAVEIKHHIETHFNFVLPIETFLEDINITQIASKILSEATLSSPASPSVLTTTIPAKNEVNVLEQQQQADKSAKTQKVKKQTSIEFSLFYFSSNEAGFVDDKYRLLIEGAKFADQHNFVAVWIPERHFHAFGGIYPNPSVLSAALAMVTENIRIRAGSVVLPLQNPIRVAEEWSVVDNLSKGRIDIAFARGWNPNDFILVPPENYANSKEVMFSGIQTIQKLWRGESISLPNGVGEKTEIKIYPLPKQREVPVWLTCSGGLERFIEAGAFGANILTALLFQSIEELAEKIRAYRESRARHGYDPETGHVTLMLHTFVDEDMEFVCQQVREPFTEYLRSSVDLWRQGFKNLDDLTAKEQEDLLAYAFERFFQRSALFGTPNTCLKMVNHLKEIGVNEIACLIDFGVDADKVLAGLHSLKKLKESSNNTYQYRQVDKANFIDQKNAEQLLINLEQLSSEEVDSLLSQLLEVQEAKK